MSKPIITYLAPNAATVTMDGAEAVRFTNSDNAAATLSGFILTDGAGVQWRFSPDTGDYEVVQPAGDGG